MYKDYNLLIQRQRHWIGYAQSLYTIKYSSLLQSFTAAIRERIPYTI